MKWVWHGIIMVCTVASLTARAMDKVDRGRRPPGRQCREFSEIQGMTPMGNSRRGRRAPQQRALNDFGNGPALAAGAGGRVLAQAGDGVVRSDAAERLQLQGTWEGFMVGSEANGKITLTITGTALRFHRDTNFWFETTFTLPAGTDPRQLHATIQRCPPSQAESIGKVVGAIFKIEDGTLTLADYDLSGGPPKSLAKAPSRYVFRKVDRQGKGAEPPKGR